MQVRWGMWNVLQALPHSFFDPSSGGDLIRKNSLGIQPGGSPVQRELTVRYARRTPASDTESGRFVTSNGPDQSRSSHILY